MNTKKLILLVFGLLTIQLFVPNYSASEVTKQTTEQSNVRYAPVNPTPEEVAAAEPTDIVVFADEILEAYVAQDLNVNIGEITVEDMTRLSSVSISNSELSDLSGVEYGVNVYRIHIPETKVTDLSPIANLTNINGVNAAYNNITDISALSNLTKVTYLELQLNEIVDISPLSNLTNLTDLFLAWNNISDISPLSNLTNIRELDLQDNNISDISPLSNMHQLIGVTLDTNSISDISPLSTLVSLRMLTIENNNIFDLSPLMSFVNKDNITLLRMQDQKIELPELSVSTADEFVHDIIGLNGEVIQLSLGRPTIGENNLSASHTINLDLPITFEYDVTVTQKVTYRTISGLDAANSNEGTVLTDDQLIDMFNIASVDGDITVDSSAVDFNTPGTYNIVFTDRLDTITCELTVSDLAPTFLLTNDSINITLGDIIDDYITTFGVSATEITNGDLTSSITIDDSAVDFNTPGSYNVGFAVVDDEGNNADATATVVISQIPEVVSEVPSEVVSEVPSEVVSEVVSDTTNVDNSTNVSDTTTNQTKNNTMTADNQHLSSTGSQNSIVTVGLITIVTMLYTVKKTVVNNK